MATTPDMGLKSPLFANTTVSVPLKKVDGRSRAAEGQILRYFREKVDFRLLNIPLLQHTAKKLIILRR